MRTITKLVFALSCVVAIAVVTTSSASAQTWSYGESGTGRTMDNAGGMCTFDRTRTFWDILVCEVIEEIPLIYPDTNTCYLIKITPPQRNTAFRVDLTVPYATFSSTVTYEDTKPVAQLRASNYVIPNPQANSKGTNWWDAWNRGNKYLPNPYEPGELIITPRDERQVSLYVTPAPLYQVTRNSGVPACETRNGEEICNVMGIGTRENRNLIFQRVYYPLRNFPFGIRDGARFYAFSDFARFGYTLPRPITCVDPRRPDRTKRCPRFEAFRDFTLIDHRIPDIAPDGTKIEEIGNTEPNITIGRPTPPQPGKNCPNRQRWDRPQLFYTHWAGPGQLGPTGQNIPDPALECTGYVISLLTNATDAVYLTRIRRPPTFVNVQECRTDRSCTVPEAGDADFKYVGIQNYGTFGGDVRYPEQSRAVGDIVQFCGIDGPKGERCQRRTDNRRYEWIFLHYTRPLRRRSFRSTIRDWANANDINVQQLATFFPPPPGQTCDEARANGQIRCDRHPPFLIYRNKQRDPNFENGYIRDKVACNPAFVNPRAPRRPERCTPGILGSCPDGQVCVEDTGLTDGRCYIQGDWTMSNLANASDGRRPADPNEPCTEDNPRGCCTEDNTSQCGMGPYSPITIRCGYGRPNARNQYGVRVNSIRFRQPTEEFLDLCLQNLFATSPRWGFRGGMPGSNCNEPNLPEDLNGL